MLALEVWHRLLERVKGIEPSYAAWEATVLPLNYTRTEQYYTDLDKLKIGYWVG